MWKYHTKEGWAYSVTRNHNLKPKVNHHHLNHPKNHNLPFLEKCLISYTIGERDYDIFTVNDLLTATYPFEEKGISSIRGDLAERISRRIIKRFLQTYDNGYGKLGGLFSKEFNPKKREGFVVANDNRYILKVGKYPNMILLKKTGIGNWGYQHITDLDGLFDYRYGSQRHMIILESKAGKIDLDIPSLHQNLFVPLKKLFKNAHFTYVLFADKKHLYHHKYVNYKILQETPVRIVKELKKHGIPTLFFEFHETEEMFYSMCRHLISNYKILNQENVTIKGSATITENKIHFTSENSNIPYLSLVRDFETGMFKPIHTNQEIHDLDFNEEKMDTFDI